MLDQVELSCSRLSDNRIGIKDTVMVKVKDVLVIDNIQYKNETRLRVRTSTDDYIFSMRGPISALGDMLKIFGFWRSDNSTLINMNAVDKVKVSLFAAEAIFKETETKGVVANSKVKILRKLFPEVPICKSSEW